MTTTVRANKWRNAILGDFFRIKHGYAFKGEYFSDTGPYILLTPGNFNPDGDIKFKGEKEKYYIGPFPDEFLLQRGDLLVVMTDLTQTASILGSPAFIPESNHFLHNQRLGKLYDISSDIDKRFLYHLLNMETVRGQIKGSATGSTVRHTAPDRIYAVKVSVPPLPVQREIAAILSAYDDLIENNLRRIKILEEMAQNLYREWFVKFRFPGHQHTRFVDSPLGSIPEGWEVVKVGDILKKLKRGEKIQKQDYKIEGLIPVVDQGKEFIGGYTNNNQSMICDDLPLIVFGDHTRVLKFINFPFACGADGTQLLKSDDKRMPITLLYYALCSIDLSDFAYARHFKFLKEELLVLPIVSIALLFNQFVTPLRCQISALMNKNVNLRRTRDLLLPKLISGEVDVSGLAVAVDERTT